jgi:hypothetical protein
MKNYIPLFALLAVMALSCGRKEAGPVPVFDVTQTSLPPKELILQDIATVEYIPLETKENFLLGDYPPIQYMDDEVIVTNDRRNSTGHIMFFDRKTGKAIRSFSRKGRGPGEYYGIGQIAVDAKAGEMFVLENIISSGRKPLMHVYDLEGKHLRTIELSQMGFQSHFHVYDDNHLFFYNEPDMTKQEQVPTPYRLVSRTDTIFTHLPVEFPRRDHMNVRQDYENGYSVSYHSGTAVLKTPEGYIFSEPGIDTIYNWNRTSGELTPLVARTPTFGSMEYPVAIWVEAQNNDYIFMGIGERKAYEPGQSRKYDFREFLYDKSDGQFYANYIVNGDYVNKAWVRIRNISSIPVNYPPGQFVEVIQAVRLVALHEEGELQGPLAEIAATLKEDDNPVIMIATLK